jgi:inward rectifier potassium channel
MNMQKPTFDPGLTQKFDHRLRRAINKDGSFNVHRKGIGWRNVNPYLHLINMSWTAFLSTVFLGYIVVNALFAAAYWLVGADQILGTASPTAFGRFMNVFFFSAQTLSTVGYGTMAPHSIAANCIASLEAMLGLMGFALATGLLFGRVSKPSAKIGFSENLLIAPYQEGTALQFRIVNQRLNLLMQLEAEVMLMTVDNVGGELVRNFKVLNLERTSILFFALTWTIVHPIDEGSPLKGKTAEDLKRLQAEVLILIRGFDDTFSQTVHSRYSYRYDEIKWGARFAPAFHIDEDGDMVLEVDQVGKLATPQIGASAS